MGRICTKNIGLQGLSGLPVLCPAEEARCSVPSLPCVPGAKILPGGDTKARGCADGLSLRFDAQLQPPPHFPASQLVTFAPGVPVRPPAYLCPDRRGDTSLPTGCCLGAILSSLSTCARVTAKDLQGQGLKGQGRDNKQSLLCDCSVPFQR